MKTKSKTQTKQWVLKNKETGKVYSNWTYPSRNAARKAAKGRRFKGLYTATKSGDGGIDPKKLKTPKKAPTPKSTIPVVNVDANEVRSFRQFMDWLFAFETEDAAGVPEIQLNNHNTESNKVMSKPVNTKPKLRKTSSAPGAKFHKHGVFGVR